MRSVRWMAFLVALLLAASAGVVFAGPNAGGVLIVHECQLIRTFSYDCALDACENADVQAEVGTPLDPPIMWHVWAAFPEGSSPRLKAFVMGSQFPATLTVLEAGLIDPSGDFEIAQDGWPFVGGGGVGVSFGTTKTTNPVDCYWIAGYSYQAGDVWALTPHPVGQTIFVDDSVPPLEDPVMAFGSLGFGVPGTLPCPDALPPMGACCFESGQCMMLSAENCAAACGVWFGPDITCDPNPCPPLAGSACCLPDGTCVLHWTNVCECLGGVPLPGIMSCDPDPCGGTPVEETTWGRIKTTYR